MSGDEALTRGGYTYRVTCRAMPNQVEGVRTADGRPFTFWARHGSWMLHLGSVGAGRYWEDFVSYSDVIASGEDPRAGVWDVETVLALLDRHLA